MTRYLLLVAALAVGLQAREISNAKLRFKIVFPDAPGWSTVTHKSQGIGSQSWTAESQAARLVLIFSTIDPLTPEVRPTFKEQAAAWEKGMMEHFTRKISSRFAKLAEHDAYELVATVEVENTAVFYYSIWMMPVGDLTYGVTILSDDRAKLVGDTAAAFLDSLEITE
jgi:hypothetical protein